MTTQLLRVGQGVDQAAESSSRTKDYRLPPNFDELATSTPRIFQGGVSAVDIEPYGTIPIVKMNLDVRLFLWTALFPFSSDPF